jgi:hypothetical protein
VAHFIWFGRTLPWIHTLALRSAARLGGFERVVLHHADPLAATDLRPLERDCNIELRRLVAEPLLEEAVEHGGRLVDLFRRVTEPAGRANIVRAGLLAREGGVYLDTDTATVRSFTPLREQGGVFCGEERLVFPASLVWNKDPAGFCLALLRTTARDVMRRQPGGWRTFRAVEQWYPKAVNNAVMGAEPGHPFIRQLLSRMLEVPPERQLVRYELGTTLLQQAVAEWRAPGLHVLPPGAFYPLGPEISQHWFRRTPQLRLGELVLPDTYAVHWYASVRTRRVIQRACPEWVLDNAATMPFSALVAPLIDDPEVAQSPVRSPVRLAVA